MSLPVIWTEARRRQVSISEVVRWMAQKPAELAGLSRQKGRIQKGFDADLVVFDPEASFRVEESRLHYRHPVSPYRGETLYGVVEMTFVRGQKVLGHCQFAAHPVGRECLRA
jgi:allantoinase